MWWFSFLKQVWLRGSWWGCCGNIGIKGENLNHIAEIHDSWTINLNTAYSFEQIKHCLAIRIFSDGSFGNQINLTMKKINKAIKKIKKNPWFMFVTFILTIIGLIRTLLLFVKSL